MYSLPYCLHLNHAPRDWDVRYKHLVPIQAPCYRSESTAYLGVPSGSICCMSLGRHIKTRSQGYTGQSHCSQDPPGSSGSSLPLQTLATTNLSMVCAVLPFLKGSVIEMGFFKLAICFQLPLHLFTGCLLPFSAQKHRVVKMLHAFLSIHLLRTPCLLRGFDNDA